MRRIIETNLILDGDNNILDHQSRVLLAESWQEYVNAYVNYNGEYIGKFKVDLVGSEIGLQGITLPKSCTIENLEYDNIHLSCDIVKWNGDRDRRLAYLIQQFETIPCTCNENVEPNYL